MPCCGAHCHVHHGCWGEWVPPPPWRYARPREDEVRALEAERDVLEQRLRRLERELEELKQGSRPSEGGG